MVARILVARKLSQGGVAGDGSFQVCVVPSCNVEGRNLDSCIALTDILLAPVSAGLAMRNPITHIIWKLWISDRRVRAVGGMRGLRANVDPGFFELRAAFSQPLASCAFTTHLNSPTQRATHPQRPIME